MFSVAANTPEQRRIRDLLRGLGECAQILAEALGIAVMKKRFNFQVGTLPNWNGADQQTPPCCRQCHETAAPIARVCSDPDQTPALERLESGSQGGPVHCQQARNGRHRWWFRTVQGHHERELPVGQAEGAQNIIEAPCQGPGSPLDVKTEASVADQKGGLKRRVLGR
jgi:hypothetical protein